MPTMMNPIRQKLQQRMPMPQSGMPVMNPPMTDEDMVRGGAYDPGTMGMPPQSDPRMPMPPMQGDNMEMPPGQGDMGMETMYPEPGPAQAMPVHDTGEMNQFYRGLGKTPGQPVQDMTKAYGGAPQGPLRSKLHAAQHQMMAGDQKAVLSSKRMELSMKRQQLESVMQSIKRGETMDTDGRMFKQIQAGIGQIDGLLAQFPGNDMGHPGQ